MSISVGDVAPDFEAPTSQGGKLKLSGLRGKKVVLYFYPKAFTPGCTVGTQRFAEITPLLDQKGVQVIGISVDNANTQHKFAESCHANFPLVDDETKGISKSYGVLGMMGLAKRVTFFLDENGKVVDLVDAMRPAAHLDRTRERFLA